MSSLHSPVEPSSFHWKASRVNALLAVATCVLITIEFATIGLLPLLAVDLMVPIQSAGHLVSAFALGAALCGPLLTLFATRWPAHFVLAICALVFGVGNIITVMWPSYEVTVLIRTVQGAFLPPFIGVASTLVASLVKPEAAGRAIGQMNIGTVVATVIAVPIVIALADRFGLRSVAISLGILAMVIALAIANNLSNVPTITAPSWGRQVAILQRFRFLAHLSISVLMFTSMFASYSYIAALIEGPLGLSGIEVAVALCAFGLAGIVGNQLASNRVGRNPLGLTNLIALLLILIGVTSTVFISNQWVGLVLLLPWGAVHTAAFVTCQVRVMFAAKDAPAFAASMNIAACNLGIASGAFIGGWVVDKFGIAGVGLTSAIIGSVALLLGRLLATQPISLTSSCLVDSCNAPTNK